MLRTIALFAAATVAVGCGSQSSTDASAGATRPAAPGPEHFADHVQNPWFPLRPGTVYEYRGEDEGQRVRDILTVTRRTKTIQGVRCTVIEDRLYKRGRVAERTTDWYATADDGTVWYFGEATATLNRNGKVDSTEGSWQSGVDGAEAGIYMPGHPRVGQGGRQEYYKGHAEDHFTVLSLDAHADAPGASSRHALLTKEFTPLEPGVIDHKVYVRGVGVAIEESVKGGNERLALESVRRQ
ncbi:MAG: hypothetical protein QOG42_85 [Solirubrobacteraceae bacterium]|nr:hypothetical protein [Solirubrobacteraceae bacterium]